MLLQLPTNLAALGHVGNASAAQSPDALRVLQQPSGLYRVEASDGQHVLAIVQGPISPDQRKRSSRLVDAQPGVRQALIPATDWCSAFHRRGRPSDVTLATAEAGLVLKSGGKLLRVGTVAGAFPTVHRAIPKRPSLATVRIEIGLLFTLLGVAQELEPEDGLELHFFGQGKPLGLSCRNDQGQAFDGLLSTLS